MTDTSLIDSFGTAESLAAQIAEAVTENKYFPTQVFSFQIPDAAATALNDRLLALIRSERDRDQMGIERSNFRALGGWHSHNNLHLDPTWSALTQLVETVGDSISGANGYDPAYRLKIGTMWSIINAPGSFNNAHVHPGCLWSGVYYVQTPKGCGNIEFTDPRTAAIMAAPHYIRDKRKPQSNWSKVVFEPVAGKLLVFPSWLYHAVTPNLSTAKGEVAERIIVSFNLSQVRRPGGSVA
jgi:uncharacterized protein (TIGR02466 family)